MKQNSFVGIFKKYIQRHKIIDILHNDGFNEVGIFVVIPAYLEKEFIFHCLNSLLKAKAITTKIAVIVVINTSEEAPASIIKEQEELYKQVADYSEKNYNSQLLINPIKLFDVKKKHFGVGYARKVGMDQVVLKCHNSNNHSAVIVSLDADSTVAINYFEELEKYFSVNEKMGCSIYFEHPLAGDLDSDIYKAIEQYELHLRYYKIALHNTGFPYAFHTVGSSFALRASQYVRAGGMPRKQAGEDFYLIQKVVQMGGYGELNTTCVYPSARPSSRVPFGTGPSVKKMVDEKTEYMTYNLLAFYDLKELFESRMTLYGISKEEFESYIDILPERLRDFLVQVNFYDEIINLNNNCASQEVFNKRFFELFNAFKVVKYLNYVHSNFLEKTPVYNAAILLLKELGMETLKPDVNTLLKTFRQLETLNHLTL